MVRLSFFLFFVLICSHCAAQPKGKYEPYVSSDYPEGKYSINRDNYSFLKYRIETIQLSPDDPNARDPSEFYCRGWLTVYDGEKIISKYYFPTIEAVGGCFGMLVPEHQPLENCFIVSIYDGYGADIYVVDSKGKIKVNWGGSFFISIDRNIIFSNDGYDLPILSIYDFDKRKVIHSDTIEKYLVDWYYSDGVYYTTIWNNEYDNIDSSQVAVFDFRKRKLRFEKCDNYGTDESFKLEYIDMINPTDCCNCGR